MTAADPNTGDDGLTEAGRQALADKAAAAAKLANGAAPAAVAAADQTAAQQREAARQAKREQAAATRAANLQAERDRAQAEAARQVAAEPVAVAEAPGDGQPCEPCMQMHRATMERLDRMETQVQAIGKVVMVGIVAGAVIYFMSSGRPRIAIGAPAAEAVPEADPAPELAQVAGE